MKGIKMFDRTLRLINESEQGSKINEDSFKKSNNFAIVKQNGAFLVDDKGKKYDLFDLPEDKTFFVKGNLVLDTMELTQLPQGINNVVVEKDLFIENNPLETFKNYPCVLGRTHVNPIVRYVTNPKMARYNKITDLIPDGTITKLANGKDDFFIGSVDAMFKDVDKKLVIENKHERLLHRCALNRERTGSMDTNCVYRRLFPHPFGPSRFRE